MQGTTHPPIFTKIDGHLLNVSQIRWATERTVEVRETPQRQVRIEFITGGYIDLNPGIALGDVELSLAQAIKSADPF